MSDHQTDHFIFTAISNWSEEKILKVLQKIVTTDHIRKHWHECDENLRK